MNFEARVSIKTSGTFTVAGGYCDLTEVKSNIEELKDGDYDYLIFDKKKNRPLPQLKYLNGVVLKSISDQLPDHPSVSALYSFFEEMFSPKIKSSINGSQYEYCDLKRSKSIDMDEVIQKIIHYAREEWGIVVIPKDQTTMPEVKELYAGAYLDQWQGYL